MTPTGSLQAFISTVQYRYYRYFPHVLALWTHEITELVLLKVYHGSLSRVEEADKMRKTLTQSLNDELPIVLLLKSMDREHIFGIRLVF